MFSRLYLHIPWCKAKCGYCAFHSHPVAGHDLHQTCTLLVQEMELAATTFPGNQPLRSIYLGGGTPSLLTPHQVETLLQTSRRCFGHAADPEITLEANPGTVSLDSLCGYYQAGVTRLSLGMQSFNDRMLQLLGRVHTADQGRTAFKLARQAGFSSIGLDLICGLPEQTVAAWQQELQEALALQPDHLSIYGLTVEEETPFAAQYPKGKGLPDDDQTATMLEQADTVLTQLGYEHYEIANFARPGCRSQHNSGYWQRDGYLGAGPGAHSFLQQGWGVRWGNQTGFEDWAASLKSGTLPHQQHQHLTRADALAEAIFLGLRMADGINLDRFDEQFGERLEQHFAPAIKQLQEADLLTCSPDQLSLTKRGMLLSNQVLVRFI